MFLSFDSGQTFIRPFSERWSSVQYAVSLRSCGAVKTLTLVFNDSDISVQYLNGLYDSICTTGQSLRVVLEPYHQEVLFGDWSLN